MIAALHVRRAGTMNAVMLGALLLQQSVVGGASFAKDRITGFDVSGGAIRGVRLASGASVSTPRVVLAAGPLMHEMAAMLGVSVPVMHELHSKLTVRDPRTAVPRSAPFVIWNDPLEIDGRPLPGGVHMRPVDLTHGDELQLIWTFETDARPYEWPPRFDDSHREILLRGCAEMIPARVPSSAARCRGLVSCRRTRPVSSSRSTWPRERCPITHRRFLRRATTTRHTSH
jgi:glycine/D-amino acid oxidase-like deaminating enzyme